MRPNWDVKGERYSMYWNANVVTRSALNRPPPPSSPSSPPHYHQQHQHRQQWTVTIRAISHEPYESATTYCHQSNGPLNFCCFKASKGTACSLVDICARLSVRQNTHTQRTLHDDDVCSTQLLRTNQIGGLKYPMTGHRWTQNQMNFAQTLTHTHIDYNSLCSA